MLELRKLRHQLLGRVKCSKLLQKILQLGREDGGMAVDQCRRAIEFGIGENQLPPGALNRLAFEIDRIVAISRPRTLHRPFQEHVRSKHADGFDRCRPLVDADEIDAFQRGECFGTQVVAEGRSVGALVDEPIGCDGDHEAIAELPRLLQVSDVPDVEQVEYTVALHDLGPTCGGFVEFVCDFAK